MKTYKIDIAATSEHDVEVVRKSDFDKLAEDRAQMERNALANAEDAQDQYAEVKRLRSVMESAARDLRMIAANVARAAIDPDKERGHW